jgi:uncharacterized protein YjdB
VTAQVSWQSADTAVATVSVTGVVTGVEPGNTIITASYQVPAPFPTVTGSAPITVTP